MNYTLGLALNKLIRRKITKKVFFLFMVDKDIQVSSHHLSVSFTFFFFWGGGGMGLHSSLSKGKEIAKTISLHNYPIKAFESKLVTSNINLFERNSAINNCITVEFD